MSNPTPNVQQWQESAASEISNAWRWDIPIDDIAAIIAKHTPATALSAAPDAARELATYLETACNLLGELNTVKDGMPSVSHGFIYNARNLIHRNRQSLPPTGEADGGGEDKRTEKGPDNKQDPHSLRFSEIIAMSPPPPTRSENP